MSLMSDLTEYVGLQQANNAQKNQGFSQLGQMIGNSIKEREDEKRRQENVKKQMANAQQMMQQMAQMGDNSSVGRVNGALDSDQQKRQRGVINVSAMMPQKEMTVDETGAVNIKFGFKQATPQEQKAQFEMQKQQMDLEREEGKRSLLGGYIKGELQEGALIQGMKEFNITPDEFDQAAQARERMKQLNAPVQQPVEGQAPMSMEQPTQQPSVRPVAQTAESFRFKRPIEEQKFEAEQADKSRVAQEKIDSAKANAESALGAINEIRNSMGYFGRIDAHLPATPGTEKVAWTKNLDRIKAMLTLDNLMELKNASKNGASGLGALSDGERKMLEDAASALDKGLPKEKAAEYLNDIERTLTRVLGGGQSTGQAQSQSTLPQVGGMFNGEKVLSIKRIK